MTVVIKVIGAKPESEEYQAAICVKNVLEKAFNDSVMGEIVLHANANIVGQAVKDIDLMMFGTLHNYRTKLNFTNDVGNNVDDQIRIESFCTAIEVKSHGRSGVYREGTEIFVLYPSGPHSATTQSNDQKNSIHNFFNKTYGGMSPYVTNLIYFTGLTKYDLNELLSVGDGRIISNVIGSDFSARDLFQAIVYQGKVKSSKNGYYFTSTGSFGDLGKIEDAFEHFAKAKDACGVLTRKRIEQITSKSVQSTTDSLSLDKPTICRGRAGTGKTIALVRKAIQLVDEEGARVLILTYNNALVSDIKRLFALADLPDMFQPSCVDINTMQSFFFRLINKGLYDESLSGEDYLAKYDSLIDEMNQFICDDDTRDDFLKIIKKDFYLNWDYCFVDEAQDWTNSERDILIRLFGDKLLIADGGQQFVRGVDGCDWSVIENKNNLKLKKSLRQENNLISFINELLKNYDENSPKILPNEVMSGGSITVYKNNADVAIKAIKEQLATMKRSGNIAYDMLIFVPHTFVEKETRCFKYKSQFLKNDIDIWDGTNDDIRSSVPVSGDQVRVLQYESGRGLEGWSVVCLELDTYIIEKAKQYKSRKSDALLLESDEDQKKKYLLNWLMLPLTRAIDNLIITFRDSNSDIAKQVYAIAEKHPDYIYILR